MLFMSCVCHAFASVHCCIVITCRERADLLALVCGVQWVFVTFPCGFLGHVAYLIVSIPDLYRHSYFVLCDLMKFFVIEELFIFLAYKRY